MNTKFSALVPDLAYGFLTKGHDSCNITKAEALQHENLWMTTNVVIKCHEDCFKTAVRVMDASTGIWCISHA